MERDDIVDLMTTKVQRQVICSSLAVVIWLPSFSSGWWEDEAYHEAGEENEASLDLHPS